MTRTAVLQAALGAIVTAWSCSAGAATLTTDEAAFFRSGATTPSAQIIDGVDELTFLLPTITTLTLGGQTIGLSPGPTVTPADGFPFALSDGFTGDLLVTQFGTSSLTLTLPASLTALGFDVAPFSSNFGGPYSLTVALAGGAAATVTVPGGDYDTGTTPSAFFGFYGGPVSSLTISTSDPNGLAVAFAVPEPASLALVLAGIGALVGVRRRAG